MRKVIILFVCLSSTVLLQAQFNWQRPVLLEKGLLPGSEQELTGQQFPIKLIGGLVFLQAELEGNKGHFILDTGAPTLIINRELKGTHHRDKCILGIGGYSAMESRVVKDFRLGKLKAKSIEALDIDMSHLERLISHPIEGLIGYQAIKAYELLLNYEEELVELLPPGGQPQQETLQELARLPFELMGHFPIIKVQIGKRTYRFGIDTGAETNLIARKHKRRLRKLVDQKMVKKYLQGIDKGRMVAYSTQLNNLNIAGQDYETMPFTFADISHLNNSRKVKLDGILGFPFLKSHIFSINFKDQEIRIWGTNPASIIEEEVLAKSME